MSKTMTVKTFTALACEAIETLSKSDARETYKSIKNNSNKLWFKFSDAETCLSLKVELNEECEELEDEIEDNPNNKDKLTKQLNNILSKSSTIRLIRDLEIAFNKKPGSFTSITSQSKVQIASNNINKLNQTKLITSTTNESTHDDDSDDEVFSFAAYMKLREQNLGNDKNKNKTKNNQNDSDSYDENERIVDLDINEIHQNISQNIQQNIIHESKSTNLTNVYPVDHDANYNIIAKHFKHDITKNKNVDHSVLDFDDLQSIKLDEDTDDDYADSQMSISNTKSNTKEKSKSKEKKKSNDRNNRKWSMDDMKQNRNNTDSDSDSSSSSSYKNNKNRQRNRNRNRHNESDDESDDDTQESDFYDGESALNIKPAIVTKFSESNEDKKNKKMKNNKNNRNGMGLKKKVNKKKPPKKVKSTNKVSIKKMVKKVKEIKENGIKKGKSKINGSKTKANGIEKEEKMELKMVSKFDVTFNKLSERAIKDCNWNNEDCEKLIDEACVLKKKEIIIHSIWILKCKEYCNKNKNKMKNMKFSVIIGYPNGQLCTVAKISEIKYCIKQKIDKIILYVNCGKIIDRDWKYIKKEVSSVYKAVGKKCKLEVKYPKSNKISDKTAAIFEQTISQIIDK